MAKYKSGTFGDLSFLYPSLRNQYSTGRSAPTKTQKAVSWAGNLYQKLGGSKGRGLVEDKVKLAYEVSKVDKQAGGKLLLEAYGIVDEGAGNNLAKAVEFLSSPTGYIGGKTFNILGAAVNNATDKWGVQLGDIKLPTSETNTPNPHANLFGGTKLNFGNLGSAPSTGITAPKTAPLGSLFDPSLRPSMPRTEAATNVHDLNMQSGIQDFINNSSGLTNSVVSRGNPNYSGMTPAVKDYVDRVGGYKNQLTQGGKYSLAEALGAINGPSRPPVLTPGDKAIAGHDAMTQSLANAKFRGDINVASAVEEEAAQQAARLAASKLQR